MTNERAHQIARDAALYYAAMLRVRAAQEPMTNETKNVLREHADTIERAVEVVLPVPAPKFQTPAGQDVTLEEALEERKALYQLVAGLNRQFQELVQRTDLTGLKLQEAPPQGD